MLGDIYLQICLEVQGMMPRNLVTLFQRNANHPNMSSFERQVKNAIQSG